MSRMPRYELICLQNALAKRLGTFASIFPLSIGFPLSSLELREEKPFVLSFPTAR